MAALRGEAGRNPYDKGLTGLVGELSARSSMFRTLWAAHDVRHHRTGAKRIHHPVVGDLDLAYESMAHTADDGLILNAFTAEPHSASADALNLLASWAAPVSETAATGEHARAGSVVDGSHGHAGRCSAGRRPRVCPYRDPWPSRGRGSD